MSEIFLPPVEQLINVDLFTALQESDVGQFGPDYTNLERYKQAGEYALEAQMYAQMAEDYGNQTVQKIQQLLDAAGNDATLLELGFPTGASKVGTAVGLTVQDMFDGCDSVDALRFTEPTKDRHTVILRRAVVGGPTINIPFYYDASDTTSVDDDFTTFVTRNGARWKVDISDGYDLRVGGLLIDGSNFSSVANKAIQAVVAKIVANGRVNNVMRTIRVKPVNFICEFFMTDPVPVPSIISLDFIGSPYLNATSSMRYAFKAGNDEFPTLTTAMFRAETSWPNGPLNQAIGNKVIGCSDGGRVTLRGPGFSNGIDTVGIYLGNELQSNLDVRDCSVDDINIFGFNYGQVWGNYNTFMCGMKNFNISRCNIGIYQPSGTYNSGERLFYTNGTVGNITSHGTSFNGGGTFTFINYSMDFVGGDGYHHGPQSAAEIIHLSGHLEGIQGFFGAKETPTNYSKAKIFVSNAVRVDPRTGTKDYRGPRKLFECPFTNTYTKGLYVQFDANIPSDGVVPNNAYACWMGGPETSGVYFKRRSLRNPGPRFFPTFDAASTPRINASIDVGNSTIGTNPIATSGDSFAAVVTGGATVVKGTSADADSDGFIPFKITLNAPTDTAIIYSTTRAREATPYTPLWGTCSVKIANAVGDVNVSTVMASYLGSTVTTTSPSSGVYTTVITPTQRPLSEGYPLNMRTTLTSAGMSTNQYQGMVPSSVVGYWQGSDFFVAGFKFTGFTGSIYMKLPVWWFEAENGEY